jgi:hypothetical protein
MGDAYRRLIGGEQELYAHRAAPIAANATVRQRVGAAAFLLVVRAHRLAPWGDAANLTMAPVGQRLAGHASLGVIIAH